MANRHTNKKLNAAIRRRMDQTGESYQQARGRVLSADSAAGPDGVDLLVANYFGWPITVAVFESTMPVGRPVILRVTSARGWEVGADMPLPLMYFRHGVYQ